jgi:hypothetical protein
MVGAICLAHGALAAPCSGIYHGLGTAGQANGTQTLPGTDVGTAQAGCQIGDLATNNVSGTGVFLSPTATPSIFQFEWGGGNLEIQEKLGNNGTLPDHVDVELGLAANTLNLNGSLSSYIASIHFSSSFSSQTLYNGSLAAGTYVIDTYSGTLAEDPTYQVNFTPGHHRSRASLACDLRDRSCGFWRNPTSPQKCVRETDCLGQPRFLRGLVTAMSPSASAAPACGSTS